MVSWLSGSDERGLDELGVVDHLGREVAAERNGAGQQARVLDGHDALLLFPAFESVGVADDHRVASEIAVDDHLKAEGVARVSGGRQLAACVHWAELREQRTLVAVHQLACGRPRCRVEVDVGRQVAVGSGQDVRGGLINPAHPFGRICDGGNGEVVAVGGAGHERVGGHVVGLVGVDAGHVVKQGVQHLGR
ncbi:MAG: hypothetical protein EBR30_30375 [Cytophagia bacterium]|nr:hypothetical protein [Cytophagia bacterium]